jgi:formate dehydrogenase subunit gamma
LTEHRREYLAWSAGEGRRIAEELRELPGACIPILHALQETFGYIHDEAIPIVADVLNLSKAEVVGVVEFYSDFRRTPPARHVVKVCLAEACQSMGSGAVVERLGGALGIGMGERTSDGGVELEPVYCLGNCALSPAMVVDGRLVGRVSPERAEALVWAVAR